jgi:uncharacterized protein GlcG (DUF336 family)
MRTVPKLSLDDANEIVSACIDKAVEIGVDMDIAITDDGGHLVAFQRMDGARITSITLSIDKAFTASAARKSTREYGQSAQPGQPAYGINTSSQGRFSLIAGGLPIFADQFIVGGIGCSSGHPDQDEVVAQAGVDRFLKIIA